MSRALTHTFSDRVELLFSSNNNFTWRNTKNEESKPRQFYHLIALFVAVLAEHNVADSVGEKRHVQKLTKQANLKTSNPLIGLPKQMVQAQGFDIH